MWVYAVQVFVAVCAVFALGAYVGYWVGRLRNPSGDQFYFREALKLWRRNTGQLDELTRRQVVQLGSVREHVADFRQQLEQFLGVDVFAALGDEIRELERKLEEKLVHDAAGITAMERAKGGGVTVCSGDGRVEFEPRFTRFLELIERRVDQRVPLHDVLDFVYDELQEFVLCERMGFAEIDYQADSVTAVWSRTDRPANLRVGYASRLSSSSLRFVAELNRPRMLDLHEYLDRHPDSKNTRLLVKEGFGSSLTFPVAVGGHVTAFLFFTRAERRGFDGKEIDLASAVVRLIEAAAAEAFSVTVCR